MRNIPLVKISGPHVGYETAVVCRQHMHDLLRAACDTYSSFGVEIGDKISKRLLAKMDNPYLEEMDMIEQAIGVPGAHMLNSSYEWACTSGVGETSGGPQLYRVLDWSLGGLGRNVIVAHITTDVGDYYNVTWPGYTGVLTAMAPTRFSAAINQPPLRTRNYFTLPYSWLKSKVVMTKSKALPPAHLLRRVFETAKTYDEAKDMLTNTPICIPVFYTLSGSNPGEGCIIERLETQAVVHEMPNGIANDWISSIYDGGIPRAGENDERRNQMMQLVHSEDDCRPGALDWVTAPILNSTTKLAVRACSRAGTLIVRGYELSSTYQVTPATTIFAL